MKHALACLLLLLAACSPTLGSHAAQTACQADRIQTAPGSVLFLASGQVYEIYPGSSHVTANWLPLDRLSVCAIGGSAVQITNLTAKGETVRALRVYDIGPDGLIVARN